MSRLHLTKTELRPLTQPLLCLSLLLVVLDVHLGSPSPSGSYLNFLSEVSPRPPTTLVTVQGVGRSRLHQTVCDLEPHNPQRRMMTSGDESTHLKKVYCCPYIQGWRVKAGYSPNGGTMMESIRARHTKVAGSTICGEINMENGLCVCGVWKTHPRTHTHSHTCLFFWTFILKTHNQALVERQVSGEHYGLHVQRQDV